MRNFKNRASKTMAIISVNTTQPGRQYIKGKKLLFNHKGCHVTCQPMSWRVNLTTQQHKFDYKSERERERKTKDLLRLRPPLSQVNCWQKNRKKSSKWKWENSWFLWQTTLFCCYCCFLCSSINHGNCRKPHGR